LKKQHSKTALRQFLVKKKPPEKLFKLSRGFVPGGSELSNFIEDFQALKILMNTQNWKNKI
jgi:hypothetical protein